MKRPAYESKPLKHPYASIEHRVMDSSAYADLGFSARAVLLLLCRQSTKDNNGHLQAAYSWMKRYGIGSEHTLSSAIRELITHGLIYRTRSHGANKVWALYALTWLPIKKRDGLFLDGFVANGWRDWTPQLKEEKKAPRKNCRKCPAESAVSSTNFQQKVQERPPQEMQTMN